MLLRRHREPNAERLAGIIRKRLGRFCGDRGIIISDRAIKLRRVPGREPMDMLFISPDDGVTLCQIIEMGPREQPAEAV